MNALTAEEHVKQLLACNERQLWRIEQLERQLAQCQQQKAIGIAVRRHASGSSRVTGPMTVVPVGVRVDIGTNSTLVGLGMAGLPRARQGMAPEVPPLAVTSADGPLKTRPICPYLALRGSLA